ncbi:MAG: alpha/beta fold hydrolase [Candidatus Saccharimonadales bacterium]
MTLNYTDTGAGQPIVLLHGMAASLRYWDSYIEELSATNRVIAIDLMGFGRSAQSATGDYSPKSHAAAVKETLETLHINVPITLVGHSMGSLIALTYARLFPLDVTKLLLVSMPIYANAIEAKQEITQSKFRLRFTYYGLSSRILCNVWCYSLRPVSKKVAPYYLKKWPRPVATDSVLHSWRAYSQSLSRVIENQAVEQDLRNLAIATTLLYGDKESPVVLRNAHLLARLPKNVKTLILQGTHNLPLEKQTEIVRLIG